jgi:3',5'-cyclic-AMP phosphodiesterase
MARRKTDEIVVDHSHDGIDRRGFLKCMAWAGTGTLCVMKGGVLNSYGLSRFAAEDAGKAKGPFSPRF